MTTDPRLERALDCLQGEGFYDAADDLEEFVAARIIGISPPAWFLSPSPPPRRPRIVTTDPRTTPDVLDGARAEYRECLEVRRLLGYLWTATGRNHLRPVHTLFDEDDPIVADIQRLAIFPEETK